MYTCGLTVYNYAHIGNLRAYLFADVLRRTLDYLGYKVTHVENITDVGHLVSDGDTGEDKLAKAARLAQKDPYEIARFYEEKFLEDEKKLGITVPHVRPRATEHIQEMIEMTQTLLDKGYAYETSDGIYFEIAKFDEYFKLSKNKLEDLMAGARVEVNPEKRSPGDFALWKKAEPNHLMQWEAFGFQGYPGWHIECSAMSRKYLGDSFDIHTGGEDHIFPHHECEIAQSEAMTGKPMAKYWMHCHFLLVEGRKMSKSLENFYILSDLEKKGYSARDFRYLCISGHYRQNLNFTWDAMEQAKNSLARLDECVRALQSVKKEGPFSRAIEIRTREVMVEFMEAVEDDLNIPEALSVLYVFVKEVNTLIAQENLFMREAEAILALFRSLNEILGVFSFEATTLSSEVQALVTRRDEARAQKDFAASDQLRGELEALGYEVKDTKEGTQVVKKG